MKMLKKTIAVITVFVLLFASFNAVFADNTATTLTDIKGHWAEQYIINVYNKGLMDAADGSLFKPNEKVNEYNVLIAISRMMRADKVADLPALVEKYKTSALDKFSVPANAREAVAFCLEKGIITSSELQLAKDHTEVTKNDASAYLGRAFGIKYDPTKTPDVLPFADSITIPGPVRPHIAFLMSKGVIDSHNGDFNPYVEITRAVFAKMLDLSNAVYEKEYLVLEEEETVDNNDTTTNEENTGTDTGNTGTVNTGTVNTGTGNTGTGSTDTNTGNTGNNSGTELPAPAEGETIVTGYMEDVIPEYGRIVVNVKTGDNAVEKKIFNVADNIECTKDDAVSYYWKLKVGDVVNIYFADGEMTKIIAMSKIQKTKAVIKSRYITDKVILEVTTLKGELKSYAITKDTVIIKDGKEASYEVLKAGMTINIITSYEELVEINADSELTTDRGVIESISFSRTTPARLIIKRESGEKIEYYVSSDILNENIIIEGKEADLYTLRPNMLVDLALENEEVTKIVSVEHDLTIDISGVVKSVNYDFSIIVLEYTDSATNKKITKNIYASKAKIVNKSLKELTIQDIKEGTKLFSVFGVEDLGGVIAETIIIDK